MSDQLHVVLVHFNPRRLRVRTRLFLETAKRLEAQGANVIRVEAGYADNPFEVTSPLHAWHVRCRTGEEIWNKEALINLGMAHILRRWPTAKYVAWCDADIEFTREDWVAATIDALQHYPVVQLFSNCVDLNPKNDFMGRAQSFAYLWCKGQRPGDFEKNKNKYPSHMHPGYGWAFRRAVWEAMEGMPTFPILGSGDHIAACGMAGYAQCSIWPEHRPNYRGAILAWGQQAFQAVRGDIGYVEGLILHHFHGYKENRGYKNRNAILGEHDFDPISDLTYDHWGLPHLNPAKVQLREDIRQYMTQRKEFDLQQALESHRRPGCILVKLLEWLVALVQRGARKSA